jgi:hypothetical protein
VSVSDNVLFSPTPASGICSAGNLGDTLPQQNPHPTLVIWNILCSNIQHAVQLNTEGSTKELDPSFRGQRLAEGPPVANDSEPAISELRPDAPQRDGV